MPSLRIIEGSGAGNEIPLGREEVVIGRDKSADIILLDTMVSRRHARILCDGERSHIADMNSRNGTFVNRLPTDRHDLTDGDEITIGESIFLFQESDSEIDVRTEELEVVASPDYQEKLTVEIPDVQQAIRLHELGATFENLPHDERDLAILYEVGRTINSTHKLDEILGHVLDSIFQTTPAERGVVLLMDASTSRLKPKFIRNRDGSSSKQIRVSQTILDYAIERGLGINSIDAMADERFLKSRSVEAQSVRSMLCVPLKVRGEIVGVVYADCQKKEAFVQKHLLLLQAIANQASIAIDNTKLFDQLRLENRALRRQLSQSHLIVGSSERMREIYDLVRRVAPTDATVLLRGESGTGKEVIARAIHQQSKRRGKPLITTNCAALAPTLLEAEIFGYERGAFTGAMERRTGRFENANGGTLFLDEIGELPTEIQAKLLRVLQEQEFERVGGSETVRVDVRIIASTNRQLETAIEDGTFREDLFYRLNVVPVVLPPLRERKEDIPAITEQFVKLSAKEQGVRPPKITSEVLAILMNYDWPGNVRELKNLIERAIVLGTDDELMPDQFPPAIRKAASSPVQETSQESPEDAEPEPELFSLKTSEKKQIERVLQICQWNKSRAAELLQISRPRLDRKIKEYDLQKA